MLLTAEINVVAAKRLWPRSFTGLNLTNADERSFAEVGTRSIRNPAYAATEDEPDDPSPSDAE